MWHLYKYCGSFYHQKFNLKLTFSLIYRLTRCWTHQNLRKHSRSCFPTFSQLHLQLHSSPHSHRNSKPLHQSGLGSEELLAPHHPMLSSAHQVSHLAHLMTRQIHPQHLTKVHRRREEEGDHQNLFWPLHHLPQTTATSTKLKVSGISSDSRTMKPLENPGGQEGIRICRSVLSVTNWRLNIKDWRKSRGFL